jgi:metallophosphoesterase superfamily enzyme
MIIDILSDLHFDYYFKPINISKVDVKKVYDDFLLTGCSEVGDLLVVAGDLGHSNSQNIIMLRHLQRIYGYKAIVCVLGNHDYYVIGNVAKDNYEDSFARARELRDLINAENGMYCLDGDVIEIDGVRFGGAMGWYNDAYLKYKYPHSDFSLKSNNNMWLNCMLDADHIVGIKNFDDLYYIEKPKLQAVYKECDVMITHINPSFKDEHVSAQFYGQESNTFFTVDGHEYLRDGTMKYWIFGHTHDSIEYEYDDVKCICNPLGSPTESFHLLDK